MAAAHCTAAGVNLERLALAFSLASPAVPTTLFSTSKLAKLELNLAQATGAQPLTPTEERVLCELRERFFSGPAHAAVRSWEGVEPAKVHAKLGRMLLLEWYASVEVRGEWGRGLGGLGDPSHASSHPPGQARCWRRAVGRRRGRWPSPGRHRSAWTRARSAAVV